MKVFRAVINVCGDIPDGYRLHMSQAQKHEGLKEFLVFTFQFEKQSEINSSVDWPRVYEKYTEQLDLADSIKRFTT